jgi:hypothetical protein
MRHAKIGYAAAFSAASVLRGNVSLANCYFG